MKTEFDLTKVPAVVNGASRTVEPESAVEATTNPVAKTTEGAGLKGAYVWATLRIVIGWTFLWAFLDKLLGLGFATGRNADTGAIVFFGKDAWIHGGSPTAGFLAYGTKGPFKDFFSGLSTAPWVEWVFMASLLLIGVGLLFGVATRLAAIGGAIWMGLFYLAGSIWPANNPIVDEHIIQLVVLVGIAIVGAGRYLGLGKQWAKLPVVRNHPTLQG